MEKYKAYAIGALIGFALATAYFKFGANVVAKVVETVAE